MPGLFGAINLQLTANPDCERVRGNLARMQRKLTHADHYCSSEWRVADKGAEIRQLGPGSLICDYHDAQLRVAGQCFGTLERGDPQLEWPNCLSGFFSLACLDDSRQCFWLVSDKRAAEPIYYTVVAGILYFAPEVKALLEVAGVVKSVDYAALGALLACGHLYNHQSLFAGIHRLPGGHAVQIIDGRIVVIDYWRFQPGESCGELSSQELQSELATRVTESVRRHLGNDGKAVILLSGGFDSRCILGAALEAVDGEGCRLNTVSWGLDEGEDGTDAYVAASIARDLGVNHTFMQRCSKRYGEQFAISNYLIDAQSEVVAYHPQEFHFMSQLRQRGFDRVIRGDEAFGWSSRAYTLAGAFARVGLRPLGSIDGLRDYFDPSYYSTMADANHEEHTRCWHQCKNMEPNTAKDFLYFTHRVQTYLAAAGYFKQVLHDHRNPLIDDAILNMLGRVPSALRINKNLFTSMFNSRYLQLAAYPIARSSGEENWGQLLDTPSPFRTYVSAQIADRHSSVWQIFNQRAMSQVLDGPLGAPSRFAWKSRTRKVVLGACRAALRKVSPTATDRNDGARILRRKLDRTELLMRFLVVKNWHDTFL